MNRTEPLKNEIEGTYGAAEGLVKLVDAKALAWKPCRSGVSLVRKRAPARWLLYGVFVLLAFYLREFVRLPERVAYNMPLFMHAVCLYWATGFHNTQIACRIKDAFSSPFSALLLLSIFAFAWVIAYAAFLFSLGEILCYANAHHRDLKETSRRIFEPVKALNSDGTKPLLIPMPHDSILEQCLAYRHSASTSYPAVVALTLHSFVKSRTVTDWSHIPFHSWIGKTFFLDGEEMA